MTDLLYQTDSYLKEFSATVVSVDESTRSIVLDRSAFYPGGGGQPCDFGLLEVNGVTYPVEKVKKQGDDVLHFLGGAEPLPTPGSASPKRASKCATAFTSPTETAWTTRHGASPPRGVRRAKRAGRSRTNGTARARALRSNAKRRSA